MKAIATIATLLFSLTCLAQDPVVASLETESLRAVSKSIGDTTKHAWKKGGLYNLSVAQGSLTNWAAGGDDFSLSVNSLLSLFACYKKNKVSWDNSLDVDLGYLKSSSLGSRISDDRFDLLSKSGYSIGKKMNVAGLMDFRSQFFNEFVYDSKLGKNLSSGFLSPGYLIVSAGLDFKPEKQISIFFSPVTMRRIMVNDHSIFIKNLYGIDSSRGGKNEVGAFATISFQKTMNKVICFKSRLDLLSNYNHNPKNIDVYMSNLLTVKLAKLLSLTWNVDMIYDDDVKIFGKEQSSPALQLKSLVGIGLMMKI